MSSVYIKAICGGVIHKLFSLDEGKVAEIDESSIDPTIKLWEKEHVVKIFKDPFEAESYSFKGIATLAAESLASLNPEVIYDRRGNEIGVAKTDPPTLNFNTHRPIIKEEVKVEEKTNKLTPKEPKEQNKP